MKSITWPGRMARRRGSVALLGAAALVLATAGCTKDAESRSLTPSTGQTPQARPDETAAQKAPQAAGKTAPGAAVPQAGGKKTAGDDSYALRVDAPSTLASGAEGTVRVHVEPKAGWKMNKEFPTKLRVTAPAGVTVAKAEQSVADAERFEDGGATFAVGFKADSAGKKAFQAKFKFAVCTDATCTPKTQELAWVVDVK